jgi:hypothetical protein
MFGRILHKLGIIRSREYSARFDDAARTYLDLVKSRIVAALIVKDEMIFRTVLPAEIKLALIVSLCAYFTARTDFELEKRGVPDHPREYVWGILPEIVLEEMNLAEEEQEPLKSIILDQTGLFRGLIETQGPKNAPAISKSIAVLIRGNRTADGIDDVVIPAVLEAGVTRLLSTYEKYLQYVEALAASWNDQA